MTGLQHKSNHKTAKCPDCGAVWCLDEKECGYWIQGGSANTNKLIKCEFCK